MRSWNGRVVLAAVHGGTLPRPSPPQTAPRRFLPRSTGGSAGRAGSRSQRRGTIPTSSGQAQAARTSRPQARRRRSQPGAKRQTPGPPLPEGQSGTGQAQPTRLPPSPAAGGVTRHAFTSVLRYGRGDVHSEPFDVFAEHFVLRDRIAWRELRNRKQVGRLAIHGRHARGKVGAGRAIHDLPWRQEVLHQPDVPVCRSERFGGYHQPCILGDLPCEGSGCTPRRSRRTPVVRCVPAAGPGGPPTRASPTAQACLRTEGHLEQGAPRRRPRSGRA